MNRKNDFDQTLQAWLRRAPPPQAPDRVLDAALERVAAQSQRRGWLQRSSGGTTMTTILRVTAVAAVLAIAALIGYGFSRLSVDNTGQSPEPSASQMPDISATPSPSPADVGLVLRLERGGEAGRVHYITVLDDGRVITTNDQGAYVERRLTPAGVQVLRDELDATGLTDASADYLPVPKPGVEPPPYGGAGSSLEVGLPGGGTAVITWFLFGDTEQDYFEPQPEAEVLEALAFRLSTVDEWLPASAWADPNARPYAPAQYRIFIYSQKWGGSLDDLPVEHTTVSWPLVDGIDAYGDAVDAVAQEQGDADAQPRCRIVSPADALPVIDALEAAGASPGTDSIIPGTSFLLGARATSRRITVALEPILPLADTSCDSELPF